MAADTCVRLRLNPGAAGGGGSFEIVRPAHNKQSYHQTLGQTEYVITMHLNEFARARFIYSGLLGNLIK